MRLQQSWVLSKEPRQNCHPVGMLAGSAVLQNIDSCLVVHGMAQNPCAGPVPQPACACYLARYGHDDDACLLGVRHT